MNNDVLYEINVEAEGGDDVRMIGRFCDVKQFRGQRRHADLQRSGVRVFQMKAIRTNTGWRNKIEMVAIPVVDVQSFTVMHPSHDYYRVDL